MNTCFFFWDFSRTDCAAWVQAWSGIAQAAGALFAIGLTIFLWRSDKHDKSSSAKAEALQLSALITVETKAIYDYCLSGREAGYPDRHIQSSRLNEQLRYASMIRLTDLPPEAAILLLSLIASANEVNRRLYGFIVDVVISSEHMQATLEATVLQIQQTEKNLRVALKA